MPIKPLNTLAPFISMPFTGLKGLSATATPYERSVHPDSRSLLPGAQSDTDFGVIAEVVHENRSEAFDEVGNATVDEHPGNAILTGA